MDWSAMMFYILAAVSVISALLVVGAKNPIHSVLFLIITFFAIAGQYILLNAQFLAVVHIIVYAGAIMVLFLFVLMLLNLNKDNEPDKSLFIKGAAIISGGLLFLTLGASLKGASSEIANQVISPQNGLVKNLGQVLFKEYVVPFEISSILFLAAMTGAVMLGKKETNQEIANNS